jgi:hypothetical protein
MDLSVISINKRAFLLKIYWVSQGILLFCITLCLLLDAPLPKISFLILVLIMMSGAMLFVNERHIEIISHFYVICCYAALCIVTAFSGGLKTPGAIWFLICPLVSFVMLTTAVARFWLFVILATLFAFYYFESYMVIDRFRGGRYWYPIVQAFLFLIVYMIIRNFRGEVEKQTTELDSLNKELHVQRETLEVSQRELIRQRDLLMDAESVTMRRNQKLSGYLNQLLEVSRREELHAGSLEYSMATIQRVLLNAMALDSVAIWHYDETLGEVKRIGSMCVANHYHHMATQATRLKGSELFRILETGTVVMVPDDKGIEQQLRTFFRDVTAETSMMICPYFFDARFAGFFSCSARRRKWLSEDVLFMRAIADTLPLAFKSYERREEQMLLNEKQEQVSELNEKLEQKITERTNEMAIMNEKLLHFAFLNAHKIRGPICRLMGIRDILKMTEDPKEILELMKYVDATILELDEITKNASTLLAPLNHHIPPSNLRS